MDFCSLLIGLCFYKFFIINKVSLGDGMVMSTWMVKVLVDEMVDK